MGVGLSRPLDRDPRCATLAPVWSPFVDAFVDTLHAGGQAVHPPPPRRAPSLRSHREERQPRSAFVLPGCVDDGDRRVLRRGRRRRREDRRIEHDPNPRDGATHPQPALARQTARSFVPPRGASPGGDRCARRFARDDGSVARRGVLDDENKWCGGETTVVQVGDQLDRGSDEIAILFLLERLRFEARNAGGELIVMNGNHETLTAAGRFRHADDASRGDLRRWRGRQLFGAALKHACGEKPGQCTLLGADAAAEAVERGRKGFPMTPPPRAGAARDDERRARDTSSVAKTETETSLRRRKSVAPLPGASGTRYTRTRRHLPGCPAWRRSRPAVHWRRGSSRTSPWCARLAPPSSRTAACCAIARARRVAAGEPRNRGVAGGLPRRLGRAAGARHRRGLGGVGAHLLAPRRVPVRLRRAGCGAEGASRDGARRGGAHHPGEKGVQRGVRGESDPRGRGRRAGAARARAGGAGDPGRRRGGDLEAALGRAQEKVVREPVEGAT